MPKRTPYEIDPASRPQPAHTAARALQERLRFEWDAWGRARANYREPSRGRSVPAAHSFADNSPRATVPSAHSVLTSLYGLVNVRDSSEVSDYQSGSIRGIS